MLDDSVIFSHMILFSYFSPKIFKKNDLRKEFFWKTFFFAFMCPLHNNLN